MRTYCLTMKFTQSNYQNIKKAENNYTDYFIQQLDSIFIQILTLTLFILETYSNKITK